MGISPGARQPLTAVALRPIDLAEDSTTVSEGSEPEPDDDDAWTDVTDSDQEEVPALAAALSTIPGNGGLQPQFQRQFYRPGKSPGSRYLILT